MRLYFFPPTVTKYEKFLRIGLLLWAFLFVALAVVLLVAMITTGLDSVEQVEANPFINYSILFIMLAWMALVPSLFLYSFFRLIVTVFTKQLQIAAGYLIYLLLLGLFMLPFFVGMYDTYQRTGSLFAW